MTEPINAYNGCKHGAKPASSEVNGNICKDEYCPKTGKKMNQKPYNKRLINLVCSICTKKYLLSFFFHTDLAPLSLDLYENLRQMLSRTDLALG